VGIAARLEQSASANEIVVGELAGRLIDHAAVLEPLGELAIKGKREPVRAYRLLEITPVAPAFESRLDAPLVGRKPELAALRKALKRVGEEGTARVSVVIGTPGVGKSRLATELTRRAEGVTALWGRCLSYGEGITYWPLREVVRQAAPSDERDAVLEALEAETPPPAPEIAWIFRRFCEALARERPLVLVFDDVHWAEPTFLELIEHLADRGAAPILVICLAREELLEDSPDFLEGRDNAERIVLDGLSAEETDALVDGLGGAILESDQRERIVGAAEGNPFFLEQLLALAVEGGLAERALPATVQALLAARLDRLGPGERGVLERGAVVGKDFSRDDVVALLDPVAAPTVPTHLATLSARGFVRPAGDEAFRFRHVLVQEAVYRAAPKRLRAELHERFADRLDRTAAELPELDELTGYHLEQAYQLRTELGEADRRTEQLSEDAGRRLGGSGMRAWKRGDAPATINLLARATQLLPQEDGSRLELLCELSIAQRNAGDVDVAGATLEAALRGAAASRDRRIELRARIEAAYVQTLTEPEAATDLFETASSSISTLTAVGDDRALGRAWLLLGWVQGGLRCQNDAWREAAEHALDHYRHAEFPVSTCLGQIAAALYWGPTPTPEAIERCVDLLSQVATDATGRANVLPFLGGLEAQLGDFDCARAHVSEARTVFLEFGRPESVAVQCDGVAADIELWAGDYEAAEESLRVSYAFFESTHDRSNMATRAGHIAEALYLQGRLEEAEHWTNVAEAHSATDDLVAQLTWQPVQAKINVRKGLATEGVERVLHVMRLADTTDRLNQRAKIKLDLGEILMQAGQKTEAHTAIHEACELFTAKGNSVGAQKARGLLQVEVAV
jgi:tetratricopeptide (TPR) repeat protein